MRTSRWPLSLFPILIASACASPRPAEAPRPASPATLAAKISPAGRVTVLADAYMAAYFQAFPEDATFFSLPGTRHDRLRDNSLAGVRAWQTAEDSLLAQLQGIDAEPLWGTPAWVTYGFLREALESSQGLRVCRSELWPVSQMQGWQASLPVLASAQPIGTDDLRRQALARWNQLPHYLDTEVADLREGLRLGYTTPKHNVELVIEQLDGLLALPVAESPFFSPAERDGDAAFKKTWTEMLESGFYPAARRYRDFLKTEYLPAAREAIAVAANPDGAACYRASLRAYTTLDLSPEQMFANGERAVAEREDKARELGQKVFGTSDLAQIHERLRADKSNRFHSRDEMLAFSKDAVERAKRTIPRWFGLLPKADVKIEPQPAYQEASSFSQYIPSSEDGSRPGTYYIDLYKAEEKDRASAEVTAFHEAYPGHHLQIAIAQERSSAHPITRFISNSGFAEGWGRYSEVLADEMGLYSSDLNRLRLWGTVPMGMVVDPGIHAMGWTRQQAIDYALSKQADMTPQTAASYVDRIAVLPGQMVTYGAGEREIRGLREQAQRALGDRFDIREFHDRVLENGSITLGMLHQRIERWLAEKGKGK
jgi:uncharacterized protein (DUF885 family)